MSYKSLMNWSFWRFEWSYILCFFISYFMTTYQFNHSIVSLRNSDHYRLASGFFCPSGGADAVSAFGSMWPGVSSVHLHPPERINVSMCWWTWANTPVGLSQMEIWLGASQQSVRFGSLHLVWIEWNYETVTVSPQTTALFFFYLQNV